MCNKFIFFMHFSSQEAKVWISTILANIYPEDPECRWDSSSCVFLVIRRQAETHDMGRKQMVRVWKGRYRHGQIRTWNSVNNTFFARSHFHHVQQILTQKSWSHGWKIQESFENSKSLTAAGTTMILYQRRLIYDGKSGSFNSDREFVRDSAKVRNTSSIP